MFSPHLDPALCTRQSIVSPDNGLAGRCVADREPRSLMMEDSHSHTSVYAHIVYSSAQEDTLLRQVANRGSYYYTQLATHLNNSSVAANDQVTTLSWDTLKTRLIGANRHARQSV